MRPACLAFAGVESGRNCRTVSGQYDEIIAHVPDGGFARYTELVCDTQESLAALQANPGFADVDIEALGRDIAAVQNRHSIVTAVAPLMLCELARDSPSTMKEVIEDMATTDPNAADLNEKSLQIICPDLIGNTDNLNSSEGRACTAEVEGRSGTVTITGGDISCGFAQSMIEDRDAGIGYFNGPNGQVWACGSRDIFADYECFSTSGPERFKWEAQ